MRLRNIGWAVLTIGLALGLTAMGDSAIRTEPAYVAFRQPGTNQVALLKNVRSKGGTLVAEVYGDLHPLSSVTVADSLTGLPYIEVAEFVGFGQYPIDSEGNPILPGGATTGSVRFETANHYSTIYLRGRNRKPIWHNPLLNPAGSDLEIGDSAQRILESVGVRLRNATVSSVHIR